MDPAEPLTHWIAVDWGTTRLRCWALSADNTILDHAESEQGMNAVVSSGGDFETHLLALIQPWLNPEQTIPVIACGMVGAKQGWQEVPYVAAPCSPVTPQLPVPTRSDQIEVRIHAGVKQDSPADVMRGEETQIAGLLAEQPNFTGLVCLPGTHTKWARVAHGHIQNFETSLTGELFSLLAEHSVLRLTIAETGWDEPAFLEGVHTSYKHPETLLNQAFRLRAEALLNQLDPVHARSHLSGLLIGHELAGALKNTSPAESICLIGAASLIPLYEQALESLGRETTSLAAETALVAGLSAGR